ncbi:MAG: hypothetical protein LUE29_11640, partial [Lachnospiraceae bacterium]|nr:hypothetical protein [Lachnospiraceae bacterium]
MRKSHHNRFSRCMAFLMVIVLCISSMTLVSAQGDDSEGGTSETVPGGQVWVWEDDEKTVTVDASDAAALPEGAEFVVEDLTEEEYEAAKKLIIDQSFRDNEEYGSTEEERVAYAQAVLSGLVLYDMHFVYEGTEYKVDSTQMTVTIENKTAVAAEEVVVVEECGVYVMDDSAESSVVAIHIEETSDGENVAEVTEDAVTDDEGAVETVELTVESFSTIGYYTITEYRMLPITDDTLINDWGGSYTLYFILNNYNIFTSGNVSSQRTVGAVAVGGTSFFTFGIGAAAYGVHPIPSYFQGGFAEGGFESNIGGNAIYLTGYDSNVYSWAYVDYDIRFNDGGTGTIDSSVTHDKGYFIDFTAAMAAIEAEMDGYVNNSSNIPVDLTNTDATLEDDHYTVTYNGSSITVTVQSGYSYEFDDLDAIDYINIITGDDENDENVNIISKEDGAIVLPKVLLNGSNPTGSETDYGCGLVFMLPNAEEVDIGSKSDHTFLGHVVAPGAAVTSDASGNTNGSFICASFNVLSMENHMWSYNGSLIVPDSCFSRFTAATTLDGAAPTDADDEFTFTLYEFDETSGEWDSLQTATSAYGTGLVSFSDITYSSADDAGTHWYLISENSGDTTKYNFDTTLYLVKVVVTSETTGTGSTNIAYTATATYYKAATGVIKSRLIQSTTSSGTTTYSIDMSKLEDITSELSSTDAETSEIFTFVNTTVKGSLWITKNVTVNGSATTSTDADGTYIFYVKDSSGNTVRTVEITITNGVSETTEVKNLPIGTYTVEEDVSLNPTGMSLTGGNNISVEVTENGTTATAAASFTNDMEKVGSLKITKNVTVNGEPTTGTAADGTYTFQINYYNETTQASELKDTVTITIENGQSNTVQVDNLAEGKYYILEVLSLNPYGMELVGGNSIVVEVKEENTGDAIPVASFTNNLTQTVTQTGSLKITKNVTVNGEPAAEYSDPTVADG